MILVALALFGFSLLIALAELYYEWVASRYLGEGNGWGKLTWPSTGRYVLIFGAILLMSLTSH